MSKHSVTACLLVIGNEILSGRTQDTNLAFLGKGLNDLGIRLLEARVIPDIEDVIVATLNAVRRDFDYVFTTGGIGPTHDDITAAAIAKAFAVPLEQNQAARAILAAHYAKEDLNEARLRMANMPRGATLIENPISKAPGFQIENVFVMAGVPVIMQAMFDSLRHCLVGGEPMHSRSLRVELPEGTIAEALSALQDRYPDVELGSYPFHRGGRLGVRLVLRSTVEDLLDAAAAELERIVVGLGGQPAWEPESHSPGS